MAGNRPLRACKGCHPRLINRTLLRAGQLRPGHAGVHSKPPALTPPCRGLTDYLSGNGMGKRAGVRSPKGRTIRKRAQGSRQALQVEGLLAPEGLQSVPLPVGAGDRAPSHFSSTTGLSPAPTQSPESCPTRKLPPKPPANFFHFARGVLAWLPSPRNLRLSCARPAILYPLPTRVRGRRNAALSRLPASPLGGRGSYFSILAASQVWKFR